MTPRSSWLHSTRPLLAAVAILLLPAGGCGRPAAAPPPPSSSISVPAAQPSPRPAPARAEAAGYDFRPAEKAAVDEFLRQNPGLRVATDGDRRPGEDVDDMAALYGVYHPYFVRGDANDDGILDFVLAFLRRDSDPDSPWFSVVVFSGRSDGRFSAAGFLERDISLAQGDISLDRDSIIVTPDTADEATRRYRWDSSRQRHVFVHDPPEDSASTPPARI
jgi:hypothetical protein